MASCNQIYVILKACPKNCYAILYLAVVIATSYVHLPFTWNRSVWSLKITCKCELPHFIGTVGWIGNFWLAFFFDNNVKIQKTGEQLLLCWRLEMSKTLIRNNKQWQWEGRRKVPLRPRGKSKSVTGTWGLSWTEASFGLSRGRRLWPPQGHAASGWMTRDNVRCWLHLSLST